MADDYGARAAFLSARGALSGWYFRAPGGDGVLRFAADWSESEHSARTAAAAAELGGSAAVVATTSLFYYCSTCRTAGAPGGRNNHKAREEHLRRLRAEAARRLEARPGDVPTVRARQQAANEKASHSRCRACTFFRRRLRARGAASGALTRRAALFAATPQHCAVGGGVIPATRPAVDDDDEALASRRDASSLLQQGAPKRARVAASDAAAGGGAAGGDGDAAMADAPGAGGAQQAQALGQGHTLTHASHAAPFVSPPHALQLAPAALLPAGGFGAGAGGALHAARAPQQPAPQQPALQQPALQQPAPQQLPLPPPLAPRAPAPPPPPPPPLPALLPDGCLAPPYFPHVQAFTQGVRLDALEETRVLSAGDLNALRAAVGGTGDLWAAAQLDKRSLSDLMLQQRVHDAMLLYLASCEQARVRLEAAAAAAAANPAAGGLAEAQRNTVATTARQLLASGGNPATLVDALRRELSERDFAALVSAANASQGTLPPQFQHFWHQASDLLEEFGKACMIHVFGKAPPRRSGQAGGWPYPWASGRLTSALSTHKLRSASLMAFAATCPAYKTLEEGLLQLMTSTNAEQTKARAAPGDAKAAKADYARRRRALQICLQMLTAADDKYAPLLQVPAMLLKLLGSSKRALGLGNGLGLHASYAAVLAEFRRGLNGHWVRVAASLDPERGIVLLLDNYILVLLRQFLTAISEGIGTNVTGSTTLLAANDVIDTEVKLPVGARPVPLELTTTTAKVVAFLRRMRRGVAPELTRAFIPECRLLLTVTENEKTLADILPRAQAVVREKVDSETVRQHDVSEATLVQDNDLSSTKLQPGQKLLATRFRLSDATPMQSSQKSVARLSDIIGILLDLKRELPETFGPALTKALRELLLVGDNQPVKILWHGLRLALAGLIAPFDLRGSEGKAAEALLLRLAVFSGYFHPNLRERRRLLRSCVVARARGAAQARRGRRAGRRRRARRV
jgi:hypothetical protein